MNSTRDLLKAAYGAFNRHDIDAVLPLLHPDVDWANGIDGGRVKGRENVRLYWIALWKNVNPQVRPLMYAQTGKDEEMVVDTHQVIRDNSGNVLVDQLVQHVYFIRDGLIERMDIRKDTLPVPSYFERGPFEL